MMQIIPMYVVSFQIFYEDGPKDINGDPFATQVRLRMPEDKVATFVSILMLNGVTDFAAGREVVENQVANG